MTPTENCYVFRITQTTPLFDLNNDSYLYHKLAMGYQPTHFFGFHCNEATHGLLLLCRADHHLTRLNTNFPPHHHHPASAPHHGEIHACFSDCSHSHYPHSSLGMSWRNARPLHNCNTSDASSTPLLKGTYAVTVERNCSQADPTWPVGEASLPHLQPCYSTSSLRPRWSWGSCPVH